MNYPDFNDTDALINTVRNRLHQVARLKGYLADSIDDPQQISSVLFLIGNSCGTPNDDVSSCCLIMNVRSALVRQPGDLCCPGGGLSLALDSIIARSLYLPFSSLSDWPYWPWWRKYHPAKAKYLALLYGAALREGFEEMRLNPFGLTFLGTLPPQHLVMLKRVIYPQVAWVKRQKHFFPNWEVERIVFLPILKLLNPSNYARYRLQMPFDKTLSASDRGYGDFLCYTHHHNGGTDILWGATFRMTMDFLRIIFGFSPPNPALLPVIEGRIGRDYFSKK